MSSPDLLPRIPDNSHSVAPDDYELAEKIGAGAWGEVWRAVQRTSGRVVAIKLLAPALTLASDDPERAAKLAWRFQREIEAAAAQDHPHIAHVYASGVAEGRPWFAMELVEGAPLDEFVTARELPLRETLCLFLAVCEGVQHAHDSGVIHRDLKPANILVREDGTPKILDFGLARFLDDSGFGATLSIDGQPLGTPMFMSPEQAAGKMNEIGVAADVYALGVILYRLATGAWPFDETLPPLQLLAATRDTEPHAPRSVKREVPRDLEAIVLRAMAKQKGERYSSVCALAQDVQHFLEGAPVTARKWTLGYVVRKRVRKHWRRFAVAGLFVALCLGFGLFHWDAHRVAAARNAQTLHEAGAQMKRGDEFASRDQRDIALLAYSEAARLLDEVAAHSPPQAALLVERTAAHLAASRMLNLLDQPGEAIAASRRMLAELQQNVRGIDSAELLISHMEVHRQLAELFIGRKRFAEAEAEARAALALAGLPNGPPCPVALHAELEIVLAEALHPLRRFEEAAAILSSAERRCRDALAINAGPSQMADMLSRCLIGQSAVTAGRGDLDAARRALEESNTLRRQIYRQNRTIGHSDWLLATRWLELGRTFLAQHDDKTALEVLGVARQQFDDIFPITSDRTGARMKICAIARDSGEAHFRLGNKREAAKAYEDALTQAKEVRKHTDDKDGWLLIVIDCHLRLLMLPPLSPAPTAAQRRSAIRDGLRNLTRGPPMSEERQQQLAALRARFDQHLEIRSPTRSSP